MSIVFRTVFFYFFIVLVYRLMGKREIGQLGVIDLIVSILIAELVAISIENYNDSIFITIIPLVILVMLEIAIAFIGMKFRKVRNILDGKPALIVTGGKVNYKEMISQRYNLDDLLLHLRQNGIKSIDDVEYAFLENNGKLSVFKYENNKKSTYPMPLVLDGKLQNTTLKRLSKTKKWLEEELKKNKIKLENVFYAFYKNKSLYIIKKEKV